MGKEKGPTKRPFYISKSDVVNMEWAKKFAENLPGVSGKYNIPAALEDKVVANGNALGKLLVVESEILDWLAEWRTAKNSLFNENPLNNDPVSIPKTPQFSELPAPVPAYVLAPFIQAATIILADPSVTEADKILLGLVKANGKPVTPETKPRVKAEEFNYPVLRGTVMNNMVSIRIVRGKLFKGKTALLQVDREGQGIFTMLVVTAGKTFAEPVQLPPGRMTAAWTYRAIYMDGETQISDWSPNLVLGVKQEPSPLG